MIYMESSTDLSLLIRTERTRKSKPSSSTNFCFLSSQIITVMGRGGEGRGGKGQRLRGKEEEGATEEQRGKGRNAAQWGEVLNHSTVSYNMYGSLLSGRLISSINTFS